MNLKKIIKEALSKNRERKYEYGCVMAGLEYKPEVWTNIQKLIDEKDIFFGESKNGGFGREKNPHITILFGVHADVPDKEVEVLINEVDVPEISLAKVSTFTNEEFDVLKFDVESEDLIKLNEMFKELPHTSSFPNYHPHMTIAYLNKGETEKYVNKINKYIKTNGEPEIIVDCVLYSKPDGSKKEYKI